MLTLFLSRINFQFEPSEGGSTPGMLVPLAFLVVVIFIALACRGSQESHLRRATTPALAELILEGPGQGKASPSLDNVAIPKSGPPKKKAMERRTSRRRHGSPISLLIFDHSGTGTPKEGKVLDRSRGGLLIAAPDFAGVGTILKVRPKNAPEDISWFPIEVRHFRKKEDRWVLGCAFAHKLSDRELLIFG
jgi:hypothetical protein